MSTGRQTVRDLVEEGKKRIVLLFICVIGLSYLMSLTSSSVWVNLPAAASLIVLFRYISYDLDIRRRTAAYTNQHPVNRVSQNKSQQGPMVALEKSNWRRKVNSPVVEAAIDQFTSHLVSEWVADLWYSRLTPDKDGPEELVQLMNGVLGEVSIRVRDINLINLLTRDIINLICSQLELYRSSQAKIEKHEPGKLSIDHRDIQLKLILASENKLHPAMFSAEAEHRVLQLLMSELISFTFKHEDLQCSFFRYTVRELLVCAVMRPVLNLANPRFINERIESLVLSITSKAHKGVAPSAQEASQTKPNGSSRPSSDQFSRFLDRSNNGVELVQFKNDNSGNAPGVPVQKNTNGVLLPKDSDMKQTLHPTNSSFLSDSQISDNKNVKAQRPGAEWGQMLDVISSRKTQALAPEHFENMWTKGRNYKKKEGADLLAKQVEKNTLPGISGISERSKVSSKNMIEDGGVHVDNFRRTGVFPQLEENLLANTDGNGSIHTLFTPYQEKNEHDYMRHEGVELESDSSCPTEDDESSTVTGLDSPGTKVWDSKNKKDVTVSHIRHPLESSEGHLVKNSGKDHVHYQRLSRNHLSRKRSRLSKQKVHIWQEVERTSFLLGDGQDILNTAKGDAKAEESSDDPDLESWGRIHSGAAASSSLPSRSISDVCSSFAKSSENSVLAESFLKLRCEVLGANIVKSGSRTFAVYSISVTDADNNCWSIKRRFRHFEELHRCLKEFPEYNLSLPPKHFLSSGLDAAVVQERCKLLDIYLKKLLQLPTVSRSIEVWDFLSVDSQMYMFSNSLSIIQTLSVDLDDKPSEKSIKVQGSVEDVNGQLSSKAEDIGTKSKESNFQMKQNYASDSSRSKTRNNMHHLPSPGKVYGKPSEEHSGCNSDSRLPKNVSSFSNTEAAQNIPERGTDSPQVTSQSLLEAAADPTLPTEWVPPNLSVPILDLVDVIFQLQDGGWIRRQAFWVAKQVLQLGMGDAFDDWLIEKIQLLRRGSVIASAIKRIEQILWPDGIFITKHPKRQRPPPSVSQSTMSSSPKEEMTQKNNGKDKNLLTDEEQRLEAVRRATFVYELMIDKAPAAFVGLFGRKEYEQCVQDVYFFLQSPLCLKQLAYGLLELLLLAAFPEFDDVVKRINEEKDQFGEIDAKKNS